MIARNGRSLALCAMIGFWMSLVGPAIANVIPSVPIPEEAQWEASMASVGNDYCTSLISTGGVLDDTYFDAARVFAQMSSYTGLPDWATCANRAALLYRDQLVMPTGGAVNGAGDWVFSLGLKMHHLRTNDLASRDAVFLLAEKSPWADSAVSEALTQSYEMSREVALALMAYTDSMALGKAKPPKYDAFVSQALDHIDQWYVQRLWETPGNFAHYPFMVGLTMQALIQAHSVNADARIPAMIHKALDGLWETAWLSSAQSFYLDNWSQTPEPSFNLLIAPAYAWYYLQTRDTTYRDRADQIFAGGVRGTMLSPGWIFNANYMWSFDYVIWRKAANIEFSKPPQSSNQPPVCTAAKVTPSMLWPPNHRLVPVTIGGISDPDNDSISLLIKKVTQTEPDRGLNRRDLSPDIVIQSGKLYLRAERSRRGEGRVYEIEIEAQDGKGGTCSTILKVTVPVKKSKIDRYDDDDDDDDDDRDKKDKKKSPKEKEKKSKRKLGDR